MDFNQFNLDLKKVIFYLQEQFASLQVGKANPKLIENIDVYVHEYDQTMKLSALGSVSIMDSQTLKIEARDKSSLTAIDKGIQVANLGLNPTHMGEYLIVKFPTLTTERRQQLQKVASQYGEDAKISIRNIRHECLNSIKKQFEAKEISETEKGGREKRIDELVKDINKEIDSDVKSKQDEMMKI